MRWSCGRRGECTCSALITSMMTPPLSMRANPSLTDAEFVDSPLVWGAPFVVGSSVAIMTGESEGGN